MNRLLATLLLSIWVGSSLGCAMCNQCGDGDYGFWGGTHPRARLASGRVGSAFDNAEGTADYSDEEYIEDEQTLDGEVIEDGAVMPAEEILPEPMNDGPLEPTPLEEGPTPEASPDNPPSTTQPRSTAPKANSLRKGVNPETYLP